eukprot:TRINITY_DN8624_c0_g1_i1.p1 TRINITY_DN8624_c0_g1~~TRINITY_DN8624_c0_g1_i1.p1  ORF type:complete len:403 (-),score=42.08 TRINITY_DN8624_c0_g1_i1:21-1229(-)
MDNRTERLFSGRPEDFSNWLFRFTADLRCDERHNDLIPLISEKSQPTLENLTGEEVRKRKEQEIRLHHHIIYRLDGPILDLFESDPSSDFCGTNLLNRLRKKYLTVTLAAKLLQDITRNQLDLDGDFDEFLHKNQSRLRQITQILNEEIGPGLRAALLLSGTSMLYPREGIPKDHKQVDEALESIGTIHQHCQLINKLSQHSNTSKKDQRCEHCNKKGHTISECYSLHGRPDRTKQKNPKNKSNPQPNRPKHQPKQPDRDETTNIIRVSPHSMNDMRNKIIFDNTASTEIFNDKSLFRTLDNSGGCIRSVGGSTADIMGRGEVVIWCRTAAGGWNTTFQMRCMLRVTIAMSCLCGDVDSFRASGTNPYLTLTSGHVLPLSLDASLFTLPYESSEPDDFVVLP